MDKNYSRTPSKTSSENCKRQGTENRKKQSPENCKKSGMESKNPMGKGY